MTPQRIVIVNDFAYVNGGASQVALSSAVALSRRGLKVTLFSSVGPVMPEIADSKVETILLDQQEIARDTNRLRAITQGIWNRKAGRAMADLLSGCDPAGTILHLHVWVKSLSSSVIREITNARFPLVVTLHDFFSVCPNGGLFNYPQNKICNLRPMSASCVTTNCDKRGRPQKLWRVARQFAQSHLGTMPSGVNHFVTISDLSEDILRKYLPPSAQFHRLRNPIYIDKQDPVDCRVNKDFLFLGRLDPEKGPALMAQAAAKLKVPTIFVGAGPMAPEIARILPSAMMTGWVAADQVRGYIDRARALVFPSLWYETQGLTVLEAAARGVPAIVPDHSAAAEMVKHGETGLVFRGGNAADLQSKMADMMDDLLAARLGAAAYNSYWRDPSTIETHTDALLELYNRILSPIMT